ncbi:MAG: replicative DNA helicase [Faecousia sp.]
MDLKFGMENWLDAQHSVLGSILIAPEVAPMVMQGLTEQDFYGACRTVFVAIRKLFNDGTPIDPVSVLGILGQKKEYRDFLLQLMEITPTAANVERYITLCREQSQLRGLQGIAQQMTETQNPDELRSLFDKANALMVSKSNVRITTMAAAMLEFMDDQQKPASYLTWPVPVLNKILYGEYGDFIVIGGYPSAGKTAFALQCMEHFAKQDKCGFFSLETKAKKLFARKISTAAGISMKDIKEHTISQKDSERLIGMYQDIISRDIELIDAAGYTVDDVRAVTMMRGYKIIFVDYLQLLKAPGVNRTEQVTTISLALHTLALNLGVTVIALSQLSRSPKDKKDKPPDMSDLRESGQIEQDADIIMLLSLKDPRNRDGQRILQISKNKEGTRPDMILDFDGATQTFTKANHTGDTVGKYIADGKKARRKREPEYPEQMAMLPDDTPVPF